MCVQTEFIHPSFSNWGEGRSIAESGCHWKPSLQSIWKTPLSEIWRKLIRLHPFSRARDHALIEMYAALIFKGKRRNEFDIVEAIDLFISMFQGLFWTLTSPEIAWRRGGSWKWQLLKPKIFYEFLPRGPTFVRAQRNLSQILHEKNK